MYKNILGFKLKKKNYSSVSKFNLCPIIKSILGIFCKYFLPFLLFGEASRRFNSSQTRTHTQKHWITYKRRVEEMVMWPFSTPKQLTLTICGLFTGAAFIAVGAHLSFSNIGPQQARVQARKDYVKARLRKLLED